MNTRILASALLLALSCASAPVLASSCSIDNQARGIQRIGNWIGPDNWLSPENQRAGLLAGPVFMAAKRIRPPLSPEALRPALRPLDLEKLRTTDPMDQQTRDLGFLLNSRLHADGVLVLKNNRVLAERYWNGLPASQQRMLLGGSRPVLATLGAIAASQGRLPSDRSVARQLGAAGQHPALRKLSLPRLVDGSARFAWSPAELAAWRDAAGWQGGDGNVRAWLADAALWEREPVFDGRMSGEPGPDADLLAWALSETYRAPLSTVLCEQVLRNMRPEHPVLWLTDIAGNELGDGLALSLRDFARYGKWMLDARSNRSRIPGWFVDTLTAPGTPRRAPPQELTGLSNGSSNRYGYAHVGGAPNRVALLGASGTSLYIDYDQRLVIALFASYPAHRSPLLLATLEKFWERVDSASRISGAR